MVLIIDAQISGISGDMILSSLVSLGANKSRIIEGVLHCSVIFRKFKDCKY